MFYMKELLDFRMLQIIFASVEMKEEYSSFISDPLVMAILHYGT